MAVPRTAVAEAPVPLPPDKVTVGTVEYKVPPLVMAIPVTTPLASIVAVPVAVVPELSVGAAIVTVGAEV